MKKVTKTLLVLLCAVLLVVGSVMGTLAYLTATDKNVNTFTAGDVNAEMDESDESTPDDPNDRTDENEYHLIPGKSYTKDPTIHIGDDSEDAWIFVSVDNGISGLIDENYKIEDQMVALGWNPLGVTDENGFPVYAYEEIVSAGEDIKVFETLAIAGSVTNADLATYATADVVTYWLDADKSGTWVEITKEEYDAYQAQINDENATFTGEIKTETKYVFEKTITVYSYVVQAEGFTTAESAWNAAFAPTTDAG